MNDLIRQFKQLVSVVSLNDKLIDLSLASRIADFEDGLQYFSALESNSESIITRNKKDFKGLNLPIYTVREYLDFKKL